MFNMENELQVWERESEERRKARGQVRNPVRIDPRRWFEKRGKEKMSKVLARTSKEEHEDFERYRLFRGKEVRISNDAFHKLVAERNGRCEVCGKFCGENLVVDHDHVTGSFRGLLCIPCNSAIGFFRDDPSLLEKGSKYLTRHVQRLLDLGKL